MAILKKILLINLICLHCSILVFAYQNDSLLYGIKQSQTPKEQIAQLLQLADSTDFDKIEQIITYREKALKLAQEHQLSRETAQAAMALGELYNTLKKRHKAAAAYQTALKATKLGGFKTLETQALIGWAAALEAQGEYLKAIEQLLQANELALATKNKQQQASIHSYLAQIYYNYGDMDKAIDFMETARNISEKEGDLELLSNFYNNLGILHKETNNRTKAIRSFERVLEIDDSLQNYIGNVSTYCNLAVLYQLENQLDTAEWYLLKSLELTRKLGLENPVVYFNLGKVYLEKNELAKSKSYALKAAEWFERENMRREIMQSQELLSKIYAKEGQYEKAYFAQQTFEEIEDELFELDKSQAIDLIENKYELGQKELEVKALDKQNQQKYYTIFALIVVLIMAILLGAMFFYQRSLKNKKEKILLQQRLLRSQMNPHFIFNALSVIQSFIYKNQPQEAGKYLAKFAKLIRIMLENSRKEYVPLEEEIAAIQYYLDLQRLRFDHHFDYELSLDPQIPVQQVAIAPMLIQPFIENAIEHGLQHKEEKGWLKMSFKLEKGALFFVLEDNGIGRAKAKTINAKNQTHQSLSIPITKERLSIYQQKERTTFDLKIIDLVDEQQQPKGTKVIISIPLKNT